MLTAIKQNKSLTVILVFFGIVYSLISLVNHYLFRTYAYDLGLYNNSLFDYAHFRFNNYSLQKENCANPLADHFDLTTVLASPLYWIFGSYTLLIVQIAATLFGGLGVFHYFKNKTKLKFLPEIAALHFFLIFGIYSALSFDYHGNVVGTMFIPWFLHYFEKDKRLKYFIFLVLVMVSKEHMAIWAGFICFGLALHYRKEKTKRNSALVLSVFAFLYFYLIVNYIMPPLDYPENAAAGFRHFRYSALGENLEEAIKNIFLHPVKSVSLFFINNTGESFFDGIKMELHTMILISGGFVFLWYPHYLLMLLPIYAQKLLADDVVKWGICYHYSIEFAPFITIALFNMFVKWKSEMITFICSGLMVIITLLATVTKFDKRKSVWYSPVDTKFYYDKHYKVNFDVAELYEALKIIPEDAKVSSSSPLVPHLAFRKVIYQFPVVDDAEFIMLLMAGNTYPLDENKFIEELEKYSVSAEWGKIYDKNKTVIFKRK